MPRHYAVLLGTLLSLLIAAPAHATIIGVGDRADAPTAPSKQLGATTYRVVIDPARGLESYDERIAAHRAAGQEPQLVIGGTGTADHARAKGLVQTAVAAAKRWPYAYSISVVNEPNESGMGVCEYARTYLRAYRALRAVGIRRVLFGEWSPDNTLGWHHATLTRCKNTSPALRRIVTHVAWHGYWDALDHGKALRSLHRELRMLSPALHITEAGGVLRAGSIANVSGPDADLVGLRYWRKALRVVKRDRIVQIVVHGLHDEGGNWNSGLVDESGRMRPAFHLIARR